MKKHILAILFAGLLCISLVAALCSCGSSNAAETSANAKTENALAYESIAGTWKFSDATVAFANTASEAQLTQARTYFAEWFGEGKTDAQYLEEYRDMLLTSGKTITLVFAQDGTGSYCDIDTVWTSKSKNTVTVSTTSGSSTMEWVLDGDRLINTDVSTGIKIELILKK